MLSCEQLRAARAMLRWRAVDLAERAGVALSTIQRAEKADGPVPMIPANEKAVRAALEAGGIEFLASKPGPLGYRDYVEGLIANYQRCIEDQRAIIHAIEVEHMTSSWNGKDSTQESLIRAKTGIERYQKGIEIMREALRVHDAFLNGVVMSTSLTR